MKKWPQSHSITSCENIYYQQVKNLKYGFVAHILPVYCIPHLV